MSLTYHFPCTRNLIRSTPIIAHLQSSTALCHTFTLMSHSTWYQTVWNDRNFSYNREWRGLITDSGTMDLTSLCYPHLLGHGYLDMRWQQVLKGPLHMDQVMDVLVHAGFPCSWDWAGLGHVRSKSPCNSPTIEHIIISFMIFTVHQKL